MADMTRAQQLAYYRTISNRQMAFYPSARAAAMRALRTQSGGAIAIVKAGGSVDEAVDAVSTQPILGAIERIYLQTVPSFAKLSYQQVSKTKSDGQQWQEKKGVMDEVLNSSWLRSARNYVYGPGAERIRKITETTRNKVRQFLTDALDKGWSIQETAKELTSYTQAINKSRAVVIARTEILSSSNHGAYLGAKSTGLQLQKVWLSTPGTRTRDAHRAANGQTVGMEDLFTVNGQRLLHPGDSSHGASASNLIGCRCAVIFQPIN